MSSIQDLILASTSVLFSVALIPSIRSPNKPALWTSISTGALLMIIAGTYLSFDHPLWFATITTFVTGVGWFTLAMQKYKQGNPKLYISPNVPWHWEGSE